MNKLILMMFIVAICTQLHANPALPATSPFVSDGCTLFAEGTSKDPNKWAHCCFAHDLYFWAGGTLPARKNTDLNLRVCVQNVGEPAIAEIMYRAVRLGSYSPIKFANKSWGNAWPQKPQYRKLTPEEISQITYELDQMNIDPTVKDELLRSLQ